MRRLFTTAAVTLVALVVGAPAALADESIPSGSWGGSALAAGPGIVNTSTYQLSGTFRRQLDRQVEVTVSATPAGTGACAIQPTTLPAASTPRAFNVTLTIPCNGSYTLVATATTTNNNAFFPKETATLDRAVAVAAPAPVVTGVTATEGGRAIDLEWDDMRSAAPDLTGYVLERKLGDGDFEELDVLDVDVQTYTDEDLPVEGGDVVYRVFSTRAGPGGPVTSASSEEAATTFEAEPDSGTGGGDGTDGSGGGDGTGTDGGGSGDGGTDGTGSSDGGGTSGGDTTSPGVGGNRVAAPRVAFSGTFLPPLLRPAPLVVAPPTTADTGYEESLPYDLDSSGNPILPGDEVASIYTEEQPGRGMAIPVATALVLALWAIHLRLLARAARPRT